MDGDREPTEYEQLAIEQLLEQYNAPEYEPATPLIVSAPPPADGRKGTL